MQLPWFSIISILVPLLKNLLILGKLCKALLRLNDSIDCYFWDFPANKRSLGRVKKIMRRYFFSWIVIILPHSGYDYGTEEKRVTLHEKPCFNFPNFLTKWSFQKNCIGIWSFLHYQERWYFFFPKISSFSLDGKWKMKD